MAYVEWHLQLYWQLYLQLYFLYTGTFIPPFLEPFSCIIFLDSTRVFCYYLFMHKIKVGVVGIGHLGSIHARIYRENANCILSAICDTDETRLSGLTQ